MPNIITKIAFFKSSILFAIISKSEVEMQQKYNLLVDLAAMDYRICRFNSELTDYFWVRTALSILE